MHRDKEVKCLKIKRSILRYLLVVRYNKEKVLLFK